MSSLLVLLRWLKHLLDPGMLGRVQRGMPAIAVLILDELQPRRRLLRSPGIEQPAHRILPRGDDLVRPPGTQGRR